MKIYQIVHNLTSGNTIMSATAAIVFLCSAVIPSNYAVNFSGEWKLNEQKSDLGQFGGRMAGRQLKINSQADSISYERTSTSQSGDVVTTKESLTFDGKESDAITSGGNAKRKSSAKWSEDGQSLSINSTITLNRNGETIEIKVKETWKLTDNGNTLSIESNSSSSFGENSMKLFYDKVK